MSGQTEKQGVDYILTVSGSLDAKLTRLAEANSKTRGEVLRKALALYEIALAANGIACRLAVLDEKNKVLTEIEGL
ncbi:hypothetical protein [Massilia sp.]|uniref:hypothetical protein n=1 Tax=Massilia sp. TaxID=1882437 RepID=UPI00352DE162